MAVKILVSGSSEVVRVVGPRGPRGLTGAAGPSGPAGAAGPPGASGYGPSADQLVLPGNAVGDMLTYANHGDKKITIVQRSAQVCDLREWNGLDGTFNNANDTLVAAWLTQAITAGVPAVAPKGTFAMATGVNLSITGDLEVNLPRACVFKGTSAIPTALITMKDNTGSAHNFSLTWRGGTFDNALGVFTQAEQSNTCLAITRHRKVLIDGVVFKGAANYTDAKTQTDSGITGVDLEQVTITNSFFSGQGDAGIYLGGNASTGATDNGRDILITNNHFSECQQAFTLKRQGGGAIFALNNLYNMFLGVTAFEASTIAPATGLLIALNKAKNIETAFCRLHSSANHRVINNDIEDFGYLPDGVTVASPPRAIRIMGATEVKVRGNRIALKDWTQGDKGSTNHSAISSEDYSYTGPSGTVSSVPGRVDYSDNDFENVSIAVRELSATGGATFGSGNTYTNVGTRLEALNASSQFRFFDNTAGERTIVGTTDSARHNVAGMFALKFRTFLDSIGLTKITGTNQTLTLGTIAAGAYAADQTFTWTGAALGDLVRIAPNTAAGQPAGLELTALVTAADTITVRAKNGNTAGSLVMAAASYRFYLLRMG